MSVVIGKTGPEILVNAANDSATDADGTSIAYSIAGGADAALFTINAATGAHSFVNAPDFEAPTDAGANNVYGVTAKATSGGQSVDQAIAVTVTDVGEGGGGGGIMLSGTSGPDHLAEAYRDVRCLSAMTKDREPSLADAGHEATDLRIADSMESIADYMRQISELLQELAARPETDNARLERVATAADEIQRLLPILLAR